MDDYGAIRRARRGGKSIHQIARQLNHSRNTVRTVRNDPPPGPGLVTRPRFPPVLGPVLSILDQILGDDQNAPPKQRHTAMQLFRRLRDQHGYSGGSAQIQRYLRKQKRTHQETFIPVGHLPGQRLEADLGHSHVDFPDGRRLVPVLVTTGAYANAPFVLALPFERTEAIREGMVTAFEFFGCVPREVWWDNPKTVATLILQGRDRSLHPRYAALASPYVFEPRCCRPRRGNEKPDAESTVKAVQRRFATPVPCVTDLDELNTLFRKRCESERGRTVQSLFGPFAIATRFAEDQNAAAPLPGHRFDPWVIHPAVPVDKYQTVAFDTNRYRVPRPFAFQMVSIKGDVDRLLIVAQGQTIATHLRSRERNTMVLDPLHYLATLGRKPGALDRAPLFRDGKLPEGCAAFRAALEEQHGRGTGSRQFVGILQLLTEHPLERIRDAVEACGQAGLIAAEAVIRRTQVLAALEATTGHPPTPLGSVTVPQVHVPLPDLSRFDQLLRQTDSEDVTDSISLTRSHDESPLKSPVSVFFA